MFFPLFFVVFASGNATKKFSYYRPNYVAVSKHLFFQAFRDKLCLLSSVHVRGSRKASE